MIGIPQVDVGILTERNVSFRLNGVYRSPETRREHSGEQRATLNADGRIAFDGHTYEALHFTPTDPADAFDLRQQPATRDDGVRAEQLGRRGGAHL